MIFTKRLTSKLKKIIPEDSLHPYIGHILERDSLTIFFGETINPEERSRELILSTLQRYFDYDFINTNDYFWVMDHGILLKVKEDFIIKYSLMMKNKRILYTKDGIVYSNFIANMRRFDTTYDDILLAYFENETIKSMPKISMNVRTPNMFMLKDPGVYDE